MENNRDTSLRSGRRGPLPVAACIAGILSVHFCLLLWSATASSVTCDEYVNLPAGLAHWKTGDMSIYCLSPPLVRMWMALPLLPKTHLLSGEIALDKVREAARTASAGGMVVIPPVEPFRNVPVDSKHWNYGGYFQDFNASHYQRIFVAARVMTILISGLAAVIVFLWSRELWGLSAGILSCGLYCLCPNIAAHGSLATTEMGAATAILAAAWCWLRFCRSPGIARWVVAALFVAIAHLCKFTAALLWPIMIVTALLDLRGKGLLRPRIVGLAGAAVATLLLVNVVYRFEGFGASLSSYSWKSRSLRWLESLPGAVPVPLPRDYVIGFDTQKAELEQGSPCYLLGRIYTGSRWYYYPVIFGCKVPLATWAVLAWAAVGVLRRRREQARGGLAFLCVCAAFIFLGMGFLADINMGLRYVLPLLPLIYIFAGAAIRHASRARVTIATVLVVCLLVENLCAAPRYLTFENIASGGPANGWRIASETYDWGQGLIDLKKWMGEHDVTAVSLAYFGRVDPTAYGIKYRLVPEKTLLDRVAVSTYFLDGLWYMLPTPTGPTPRFHIPFNAELRAMKPIAVVGATIFVYSREDFLAARQRYEAATMRTAAYFF